MSAWVAKRFWKTATIAPCEGGHQVLLDARPVKTPLKHPLVLPTAAMAGAIAEEWDAQQGQIRPDSMPMTRYANSAIDKVTQQFDAVVALVAAYGETDLLCYRATGPEGLVARQEAGWQPLLDWAATHLGAPLITVAGVMHQPQPAPSLASLRARTASLSPFRLAAFHDIVAISGSLVLGFAVIHGRLTPDEAWMLSRIDENWQAELWGQDDEAMALAATRRAALLDAARFQDLCG